MKKLLSLILILTCLLTLAACAVDEDFTGSLAGIDGIDPMPQEFKVYYNKPENTITQAPSQLLLDWDIKSVRDIYAEIDSTRDYSMPVYRFDTFEEFLHLGDIIGEEIIPTKAPEVIEDSFEVYYYDYKSGTFDNYSLLLGWFTVESHHKAECYHNEVECLVEEGKLSVSLIADCNCTLENEKETISGLVWVAVPKSALENCESISFLLKDCFIPEENQ